MNNAQEIAVMHEVEAQEKARANGEEPVQHKFSSSESTAYALNKYYERQEQKFNDLMSAVEKAEETLDDFHRNPPPRWKAATEDLLIAGIDLARRNVLRFIEDNWDEVILKYRKTIVQKLGPKETGDDSKPKTSS